MSAEKTITINEIYHSIQGESTWAGRPCVFVRLTFCDLRCTYCDTEYAFYEGKKQSLPEIIDAVVKFDCPLVEITGGEPLLQKNVLPLMSMLADAGQTVLLETSGAHDISAVDSRVHRIMDLKTPGSGEVDRNLWSNIANLKPTDEIKFVIGSVQDYEWAKDCISRHNLASLCPLLELWEIACKLLFTGIHELFSEILLTECWSACDHDGDGEHCQGQIEHHVLHGSRRETSVLIADSLRRLVVPINPNLPQIKSWAIVRSSWGPTGEISLFCHR